MVKKRLAQKLMDPSRESVRPLLQTPQEPLNDHFVCPIHSGSEGEFPFWVDLNITSCAISSESLFGIVGKQEVWTFLRTHTESKPTV